MILIIGGAYQGKREYAVQLSGFQNPVIIDGTQMISAMEASDSNGIDEEKMMIWNHFHLWVKSVLEEDLDPYHCLELVLDRYPDLVIVSNEMGSGIVPVEEKDRTWRETTGRLCCQLAKKATEVHRVNCGLGSRIK